MEIWRDGFTWEMDYSKGIPISELRKMGPTKRRGTKIHFLPDRSIFTVTEYNFDTLANRLRQLAFLNKGIEITLTDERQVDAKGELKSQVYKYTGGIAEFIKLLNKGKQVLHEKPIYMETEQGQVVMEIALQYNDAYSETVFSLRQQHQHGRWRNAPLRLPHRAHAHHQRRRAAAWAVQGREGEPLRRRRARGPGRRGQREAAAAAV